MTLNERFVGGIPRVLLLLFCLFCFVGICLNMMRKSEKNLKSLTKNQTHHILEEKKIFQKKKKTLFFPEGWHGPCQPISQKTFFFPSPSFKKTQPLSSFKLPYLSSFIIPNINHNQNQLSSIQTPNSYTIKP